MNDLWQRFLREGKANKGKAAVLAGLFLFGCCFWVPMLGKSVAPKQAHAAVGLATPAPAPLSSTATASVVDEAVNPDKFWNQLSNTLASDPLFQSADVAAVTRDPFVAAKAPEPVVEVPEVPPEPKIEGVVEAETPTLQLSSTVIGRTRKAAMINGTLYQLGRSIKVNGRSYLLKQIESNRVVLACDDDTLELKLARRQLKDVLESDDVAEPR
jgi:hypothetical protein